MAGSSIRYETVFEGGKASSKLLTCKFSVGSTATLGYRDMQPADAANCKRKGMASAGHNMIGMFPFLHNFQLLAFTSQPRKQRTYAGSFLVVG